jgi:hypothetical protein
MLDDNAFALPARTNDHQGPAFANLQIDSSQNLLAAERLLNASELNNYGGIMIVLITYHKSSISIAIVTTAMR